MKDNGDLSCEDCLEFIASTINLDNWPKECENCKAKITKKIWLRMSVSFPGVDTEDDITEDAMFEILKQSYCEKCKDLIKNGMIVETYIP